ncbi:enoyl-CoA hydratase/isomerase family protein [Aquihabitans sp. G128]|uniref:enoyl-CoA hydratase/isomerase family protein n=1 Tax=Aquihabitans sp. G128 TaxID=2849779 RepID=UPI001C22EC9E|nr:enoyl-CoA hydratase-related protein [Aquihabitans sp. G128]QXC63043.1 enoyl-CoA hydratase/isomerase family protein [Aquihabitans sp. G128]
MPTPSSELPLDEQVRHTVDERGVAWITLDRPDVKNAISPDQRDRVIALLAEASADLGVRAVVLGATGDAFCTGADLRARRAPAPRPDDAPARGVGEISKMIREGAQALVAAIMDCEKPVIAKVGGTAAGIGAHIALACDLVIAAEGSRFIEVFVRRGLVPDGGGAYLLPRIVGLQKAKELLFFGDDIPAAEALALGLVNRVVPADELDAAVDEWAGRLAVAPTRALALTKSLVNRSLDSDRATAFAEEATAQELNMGTVDANEGVAAFVERRTPAYRGW